MIAFVTVGSTRFDALVEAALSKPFLDVLRFKGFVRLILQRGRSRTAGQIAENEDYITFHCHGIDIESWRYKPSLRAEIQRADIVLSHAGSGTIIEVLRLHKPLVVIPNPTLLDDHQQELAKALEGLGYLKTSTVSDLARTLGDFNAEEIVAFPRHDSSGFGRLVDEEMGFQ